MSRRTSRWMAYAFLAAIGLQLLGAVDIQPLAPATAPATPIPYQPARYFGQGGVRTWANYDLSPYCSCEPSIGVAWGIGEGKTAMYQAYSDTLRLDWDDSVQYPGTPPITVSERDSFYYGGNAVGASSPINYDPILYTDYDFGRTFAGGLVIPPPVTLPPPVGTVIVPAGCSHMSYTDDNGLTWTPMTDVCASPSWDHQSISSGPWAAPIPDQAVSPIGVYYCANSGGLGFVMNCWVSYDGGLTFVQTGNPTPDLFGVGPSTLACGGLHGHIRVSRVDGTVYVPNKDCAGLTGFAVSQTNGLMWDVRTIPAGFKGDGTPGPSGTSRSDPSLGISEGQGWIYYGQTEEESSLGAGDRGAWISMSKDKGLSWEAVGTSHKSLPGSCFMNQAGDSFTRFNVGCLVPGLRSYTFADVIAGDDDRAAFSFLGSPSDAPPSDFAACNVTPEGQGHVWNLYVAITYDAGATWEVDLVTRDAVQRGDIWQGGGGFVCRNLLDFQDMAIDKEGRILVAYGDGCNPCAGFGSSTDRDAAVARLTYGRGLHAAYDCAITCEVDTDPIGGVADPTAGACQGPSYPQVTWQTPEQDAVVRVAQPPFSGIVDRNYASFGLTAEAWGAYAGRVGVDIPIVGTADCSTVEDEYDCLWTAGGVVDEVTFSPAANQCATNVRYAQAGKYQLHLTVTDPATGNTSNDMATVVVTDAIPPRPRCPAQATGILVDDDGDEDAFAAAGSPAGGGANEITCFGADFDTATNMVEFTLFVADSMSPVGSAAELYWLDFTPDFGDSKGMRQVIEVYWNGGGAPAACFIDVQEASTGPGPASAGLRNTRQPNPFCDPAKPATAAWAADGLVVSFPAWATNTVTAAGRFVGGPTTPPSAGDRYLAVRAQAWHLSGATDWATPANNGPSACAGVGGGDCAEGMYVDDDFSPNCSGATLKFVTPTRLGLESSCNPNTVGSVQSAPGPAVALEDTPTVVVEAVQGLLDSLLAPFGLPAPALPGDPIAVVESLDGVVDGLPVPDVPTVPAVPGTLPALPSLPGLPGVPVVPASGGTSMATPPPTGWPSQQGDFDNGPPGPGVREFVVVEECKVAPCDGNDPDPANPKYVQVSITVRTDRDTPVDDWSTLLPPYSARDNGEHTVRVSWYERPDPNGPPIFLDDDILRFTVAFPIVGDGMDAERRTDSPRDGSIEGDSDGDGVPDKDDNCSSVGNGDQADIDLDAVGDACDPDKDGDGVDNGRDVCPAVANPGQRDLDGDLQGDVCDTDVDGDLVPDAADNCRWVANPDQRKTLLGAATGDACNDDMDGDGVPNISDPCPADPLCPASAVGLPAGPRARHVADAETDEVEPKSQATVGWSVLAVGLATLAFVLVAAFRRRA